MLTAQSAVAIATFIYSLTTFRRLAKYDDYQLTESTKMPFASAGIRDLELGNSVDITSAGRGKKKRLSSPRVHTETVALKSEIDRRIGLEFGWSSPPGRDRSSSVVGSGKVPSSRASQTSVDLRRSRSWATEVGVIQEREVREGEDGDDDDDDDGTETVRGSYDPPRHGSIPTVVVVSPHGEDDMHALLPGRGYVS